MARQAVRHGRRPRRRRRVPHGRARARARRARPSRESAAPSARRSLVIRDTRESGEMLEAALGGRRRRRRRRRAARRRAADPGRAAAGRAATASTSRAVISASHNPYRDNGIKFFGADGYKLVRRDRGGDRGARSTRPARCRRRAIGRVARAPRHARGLPARAARALRRPRPQRASTSCSTAPTARRYRAAPEIFRRLGAQVDALADEPDGRNINDGCGSTHVERARRARARRRRTTSASPSTATATACSPSTATGTVVDGDELIALAALHLRAAGRLPGNGVAVTVMTNYGFHTAMATAGHRGRHHRRRRPLRARGAARARLGARRRAVRPHHRPRLRALGRRDRRARC